MVRGLLEDDHEWRICLEEAIAMQSGVAYYWLLVVILLTNEVAETHVLWDQFKAGLLLSMAVNALSDHPRWMFKKNLMEFFIGLDFYLYYFYSGCTLHGHMSFQNVL